MLYKYIGEEVLLHSTAWPSKNNWTNFIREWSGYQCTWRGSKCTFWWTTCRSRSKHRCSSQSLEGIYMAYSIRWWLQKARLVNPCPKSLQCLKCTSNLRPWHHHVSLYMYLPSQKLRSQRIYCRVHGWTLTISHTLQLRQISWPGPFATGLFLVCEATHKCLFTEKEPTMERVLELTLSLEAAQKNAQALKEPDEHSINKIDGRLGRFCSLPVVLLGYNRWESMLPLRENRSLSYCVFLHVCYVP